VPVPHGRHTAQVIRGARFVLCPGHWHVSLLQQTPQLCADLLALTEGAVQ
jgi:hypothetical protein